MTTTRDGDGVSRDNDTWCYLKILISCYGPVKEGTWWGELVYKIGDDDSWISGCTRTKHLVIAIVPVVNTKLRAL